MAMTSIGSASAGLVTAELMQRLTQDLGQEIGSDKATNKAGGAKPEAAEVPQNVDSSGRLLLNPVTRPLPITDVAATLFSEVATSDIVKLSEILDPAPDQANTKVLDSLLHLAVQEVAKGNPERAVGYLANYATRDPRRVEALPFEPALQPLRDKIDSMVGRMTQVAKMSAEDGLSRAEQTASQTQGKLVNWDTSAEVLIKMAQRLFEAGGFANYSRTTDIARVITDAASAGKPVAHALAATASVSSAQAVQTASDMVPGINIPYWTSPDIPLENIPEGRPVRRASRVALYAEGSTLQNLLDLKAISKAAVHQLWRRAPLLLFLLGWFAAGLAGGVLFAVGSRIWPDSPIIALGNLGFNVWGIGFLALVGFGFYMRVRDRPVR
jgi:hypothetical protein